MNYEIIDNITSADIAVRVKAPTLSLIFRYGAEALMSVMVDDITSIVNDTSKGSVIEGDDISLLYFEFLNDILFFKDSESLLLLPHHVEVLLKDDIYRCEYTLHGETIDRIRHRIAVDIKAVTLHRLEIYNDRGLYIAESVFDV